jgi:hypothetical protein
VVVRYNESLGQAEFNMRVIDIWADLAQPWVEGHTAERGAGDHPGPNDFTQHAEINSQITHIQFLTLLYPSRVEARLIIFILGACLSIPQAFQMSLYYSTRRSLGNCCFGTRLHRSLWISNSPRRIRLHPQRPKLHTSLDLHNSSRSLGFVRQS